MARGKQTELNLSFVLTGAASSHNFIDLAQCYSLVNRISVRQGMQYAVSEISIEGGDTAKYTIARLPEHWPCINAWEMGYHIWQESQEQVLENEPSIAGRYRDYKIFMNAAHQAAGFVGNLIPETYAVGGFAGSFSYDWSPSEIEIPNDPTPAVTTAYNMHMISASNASSKGLITGYANARSRPQRTDPNVPNNPAEDWMREAFDVGEVLEEIRDDLVENNNEPPYVVGAPGDPDEFYPGGFAQGGSLMTEGVMPLRGGTALAKAYLGGFTVPCGLLRVSVAGVEGSGSLLRIKLLPGGYKGTMARPMQDVN